MRDKIVDVLSVGLFSSLFAIVVPLYYPNHKYISSILGSTIGGVLGCLVGIAIINLFQVKTQPEIKISNKSKPPTKNRYTENDDLRPLGIVIVLEGFFLITLFWYLDYRNLLFIYEHGSILALIGYFGSTLIGVGFFGSLVLTCGIGNLLTAYTNDNNALYIAAAINVIVPATGFIDPFYPIIIYVVITVISVLHVLVSNWLDK